MTSFYAQLLASQNYQISEKNTAYEIFTERHLQALWLEQKYIRSLQTIDGTAIDVLSPGAWNSEAGPDFLKAHLRIGNTDLRGDIELHLAEEGWVHHGHHEDERYNQVILHIALWPSTHPRKIIKKNGENVLQCVLEPLLTIPLSRIQKLLDLDLYPYKKFLGSGKCAQSLFRHLTRTDIESFFRGAALWRLLKKREYLLYRLQDPQQTVSAGIAMALGYKHNAEAFLELFLWLNRYKDVPAEELLAIALGASGFFEERFGILWECSDQYKLLETFWEALRNDVDHQANFILHQVRPYNHPVRRLAYMVHMLRDNEMDKLAHRIEWTWNIGWKGCNSQKGCRELYQYLFDLIPTYSDLYWNSHYTFEKLPQKKPIPLIGGDLKREIVVNTALPYLYDLILQRGNTEETQTFERFYHSIHASGNSKAKYLTHRFFGDAPKARCLSSVDCEQGAFQLHRDFCQHYEASCIGCPFVDRYKTLKNLPN